MPLVPAAAALITGVAAGRASIFFPCTVTAVSLIGLSCAFLFRRLPFRHRLSILVFYCAGVSSFFIYGPGAHSDVERLLDKGPVTVTGKVVRPPEEREGYTLVFLVPEPRVPRGRFARIAGRDGLIRLTVKGSGLGISYGDILKGVLDPHPPRGFHNPGTFDWGEYARLNGVDAVAYAHTEDITRLGNRAGPFLKRLYFLRQRLVVLSEKSMPGSASAIFRAMVLGDQGGITDEMRDAFAASGTTHILSVSGSHVALLAALVFFIIKWAFFLLPHPWALRLSMRVCSRKTASALTIPVVILYCMLAGSETATVRSVIMITAYLLSILLDRESDITNTLSASAIAVVFWDPSSVFDISFQLSYGSVLFMALAARELREVKPLEKPSGLLVERARRSSVTVLVTSIAAILGTAPLVARQFNAFSYVALPANLLILPAAGFAAVPLGLLSCLIYALSPSGVLPFAGINTFVLETFYAIVRFFASAPSANLHPPAPSLLPTALFYAAIAATLAWKMGIKEKGAAVLACAVAFSLFTALPSMHGRSLRVTFLDVGNGDAALVEFPDGWRMLVDGGGARKGIDPGRATVAPYLWNHGIRRLDCIVLTHPHPDHMDGLFYVLKNFDIGEVWEGGLSVDTPEYMYFREIINKKKIPTRIFSDRGEMSVSGARVQVLHTSSDFVCDEDEEAFRRENNRSLVLRIKYGEASFLLAGDIEHEAEEALLNAAPPLPLGSTVLKVPHHGGAGSFSEAFYAAIGPKAAVIPVGRYNPYRHPCPDTLAFLERAGARVLRTDVDGAVTFTTDGKRLDMSICAESSLKRAGGLKDEMENWGRLVRASL